MSRAEVGTANDPLTKIIEALRAENEEFKRPKKILFVEDDEGMHLLFQVLTADFNCEVTYALDGNEGIRLATEQNFDLIILDEVMPGGPSGTDVFKAIRQRSQRPPVTFFTGRLDYDKAKAIEAIGFVSYIQKPMNPSREYFATFMEHFGIRPKEPTK